MNVYQSLTDLELVERFSKNEKAALEEIYLRYFPLLYKHAAKMLRDKDMAKDVVHDLFANLMGNMDRLSINVPISAYLYRAVSNQVIKQYHKDGLERAR